MWNAIRTLMVPSNPMEFWTMALVLATVALVAVAARGLRSLRLTRKDMTTRAAREARACAVARAEEWATHFIPEIRVIMASLTDHGIQPFVPSEVHFDPDTEKDVADALQWTPNLPKELAARIVAHLNRMEAWAMYFTARLADDDLVFGPCAPTYCRQVIQHYPVLLSMRSQEGSGDYPHTVALFKVWMGRFGKIERAAKMDEYIREMNKLQREGLDQLNFDPPLGLDPA